MNCRFTIGFALAISTFALPWTAAAQTVDPTVIAAGKAAAKIAAKARAEVAVVQRSRRDPIGKIVARNEGSVRMALAFAPNFIESLRGR